PTRGRSGESVLGLSSEWLAAGRREPHAIQRRLIVFFLIRVVRGRGHLEPFPATIPACNRPRVPSPPPVKRSELVATHKVEACCNTGSLTSLVTFPVSAMHNSDKLRHRCQRPRR